MEGHMESARKVFVKTYGCQMNVYDSERMAEAMGAAGYVSTGEMEQADLILLNTCHIREKAAEKVYSELGRLKPLKKARPNLKIAVAGCVAQAEGEEIVARQPMVDVVVGPQAYHRLPDMVARAGGGVSVVDTDFPAEDKFEALRRPAKAARGPSAFLTVQEGCDKFCSFCVVPYTRGAEASRPADRVLGEARRLVEQGVREITLLGQNVNAYHGASEGGATLSLADLVYKLAEIPGLERIRYTTSHPRDMDEDLIEAHGACPKLMPYLHLPVQSGSDRILKAMNRRHRASEYIELVGRIRAARPDILLSGDFIVGFPGETERDFEDTLDLVREVRYGQAYSFKYSPRPGTPAAEMDGVDPDAASRRLQELQALLSTQQTEAQERMVGETVDVLFEKRGRREGQLVGKSGHLHAVHAMCGDEGLGAIRRVRIDASETHSLSGTVVG